MCVPLVCISHPVLIVASVFAVVKVSVSSGFCCGSLVHSVSTPCVQSVRCLVLHSNVLITEVWGVSNLLL